MAASKKKVTKRKASTKSASAAKRSKVTPTLRVTKKGGNEVESMIKKMSPSLLNNQYQYAVFSAYRGPKLQTTVRADSNLDAIEKVYNSPEGKVFFQQKKKKVSGRSMVVGCLTRKQFGDGDRDMKNPLTSRLYRVRPVLRKNKKAPEMTLNASNMAEIRKCFKLVSARTQHNRRYTVKMHGGSAKYMVNAKSPADAARRLPQILGKTVDGGENFGNVVVVGPLPSCTPSKTVTCSEGSAVFERTYKVHRPAGERMVPGFFDRETGKKVTMELKCRLVVTPSKTHKVKRIEKLEPSHFKVNSGKVPKVLSTQSVKALAKRNAKAARKPVPASRKKKTGPKKKPADSKKKNTVSKKKPAAPKKKPAAPKKKTTQRK